MYGIIYTVHVPLCSIHFLISLIDKKSSFPMLYNPTFLYTFVFSISWLLKPAMYAYKYRLAFLSETNRWLSINYQTKKVCQKRQCIFYIQMIQPLQPHSTTACQRAKAAESTPRKRHLPAFSPFSRKITGASADLWMSRKIRGQAHRSADCADQYSATYLPGKFSGYES